MLTALLSVIVKEYRQTFRDRRMIWILTVAPLLQLLLLGFAVNLEVEHVPTVIADEDRSPESRALVDALCAGDAFDRAIMAQNAVVAFAMRRAEEEARQRLASLAASAGQAVAIPRVNIEPRVLYNPRLESRIYFVPGVAAALLVIVTLVTTAGGLTREKEAGTLEQVLVSPLRTDVLIVGKTLPYALIGLVDLGYVLAAGTWVFGVPLRGPLWVVFLAGALYMLTTLGVGLLLGTLARTQQQALMGTIFFMMPAIVLSGFITPVENMPGWLRPLSGLSPIRHFVEILRAVLLKGAGVMDLGPQLVALAGIGIVVFVASAALLRRRLA
ncbi:MAG: ABC transporter permease [Deltaproteobacteria bacterium]|nr:ABC transporter permease [Deltaproteobacteria bacterium]